MKEDSQKFISDERRRIHRFSFMVEVNNYGMLITPSFLCKLLSILPEAPFRVPIAEFHEMILNFCKKKKIHIQKDKILSCVNLKLV